MLSDQQKRERNRQRLFAVRGAWRTEQTLARQNRGTRRWSAGQREELLATGRVKGYEGHHMKSVKAYPQYAGNPKNIQLLTESEHLRAHNGNYKNQSNGYYNVRTRKMENFKQKELRPAPILPLKQGHSESRRIDRRHAMKTT